MQGKHVSTCKRNQQQKGSLFSDYIFVSPFVFAASPMNLPQHVGNLFNTKHPIRDLNSTYLCQKRQVTRKKSEEDPCVENKDWTEGRFLIRWFFWLIKAYLLFAQWGTWRGNDLTKLSRQAPFWVLLRFELPPSQLCMIYLILKYSIVIGSASIVQPWLDGNEAYCCCCLQSWN